MHRSIDQSEGAANCSVHNWKCYIRGRTCTTSCLFHFRFRFRLVLAATHPEPTNDPPRDPPANLRKFLPFVPRCTRRRCALRPTCYSQNAPRPTWDPIYICIAMLPEPSPHCNCNTAWPSMAGLCMVFAHACANTDQRIHRRTITRHRNIPTVSQTRAINNHELSNVYLFATCLTPLSARHQTSCWDNP